VGEHLSGWTIVQGRCPGGNCPGGVNVLLRSQILRLIDVGAVPVKKKIKLLHLIFEVCLVVPKFTETMQ